MKLGILNSIVQNEPLEDTLKYLSALGVESMEMGCGGFPGNGQLNTLEYLNNEEKCQELLSLFDKYNMTLGALACHVNPVHPIESVRNSEQKQLNDAIELANKLNVKTVITFSGCPGGNPDDTTPNWITCSFPYEYKLAYDYQWDEVLVPYWKSLTPLLEEKDVRIAIEMHPGFCVYNPLTMQKLISEVNSSQIGVNFDPSHLFWQQVNVVTAIKDLGKHIYHFHAKDTYIDIDNTNKSGVLDSGDYGKLSERNWYFVTIGYGNDTIVWKNLIYALKSVGYDGMISIEHEDPNMDAKTGLENAIRFLKPIIKI